MNWNKILNWKLYHGSHKFPGPRGGTCINEAAIVAAGFKYREVSSWQDCPPCFSPVIATYALKLNDNMPFSLRQKLLMPFVTRLAGTNDRVDVEYDRAAHIFVQTVRRILPTALRFYDLDATELCERAASVATATAAVYVADTKTAAAAVQLAVHAADKLCGLADEVASHAAEVADQCSEFAASEREFWATAVQILDEAIALGRQADPMEVELVVSRMNEIRQHELEPA